MQRALTITIPHSSIDKRNRLCYNRSIEGSKPTLPFDTREVININQRDKSMSEEFLPYSKYGEWENGHWCPYEDMEEA